jgi:hypothetical protein
MTTLTVKEAREFLIYRGGIKKRGHEITKADHEATIRKIDAALADLPRIPSFADDGGDVVSEDDVKLLADKLFGPYVLRKPAAKGPGEADTVFGRDGTPADVLTLADFVRITDEATAAESFSSANTTAGRALDRPASSGPTSYAVTGGAALAGVTRAPEARVVPISEIIKNGPGGTGVVPPILRTGYVMAQLAASAQAEIAIAVAKATSKAAVAKAAGSPRQARIIARST